jgi:hypothetical protein
VNLVSAIEIERNHAPDRNRGAVQTNRDPLYGGPTVQGS